MLLFSVWEASAAICVCFGSVLEFTLYYSGTLFLRGFLSSGVLGLCLLFWHNIVLFFLLAGFVHLALT
jgi:uncharacterized membrane protein